MENFNEVIVESILGDAAFECKPPRFKEVKTTVHEAMHDVINDMLSALPVFNAKDLEIKHPLDDFKQLPDPMFDSYPHMFILIRGDKRYLIKRSGSNFCRYVLRID